MNLTLAIICLVVLLTVGCSPDLAQKENDPFKRKGKGGK